MTVIEDRPAVESLTGADAAPVAGLETTLPQALYWQQRRQRHIRQGLDPVLAGEQAWRDLDSATPVQGLLRHMAKHCSDYHIAHDLDAVLDACSTPESRGIVEGYARARRNAPGWNPRSYEPGKRHNPHTPEMIPQLLENRANARCADTECGAPFQAARKSTKYCSNACRVRSHRRARVTRADLSGTPGPP